MISKGVKRYPRGSIKIPIGVTSKNHIQFYHIKFLYPKGIMKGPLNRGGAYIKWNGPLANHVTIIGSFRFDYDYDKGYEIRFLDTPYSFAIAYSVLASYSRSHGRIENRIFENFRSKTSIY